MTAPTAAPRPDHPERPADRPIALVTGASRGIGAAIARDLGRDHHVIVGATGAAAAAAIAAELPDAETLVADLADDAALAAAVAALDLDRLDVLVHNAGIVDEGPVAEVTRDRWRRIFEVNVFAVAELTRLLLPALRAAGGTVVMINSGSGYRSGVAQGPYSGTKFALRALTMALREEERGRVRVSSVHPGKVDTDMQREIQAGRGNGPDTYDGAVYVRPGSIAAAVRLAVDATAEAMVEEVTVRPVVP